MRLIEKAMINAINSRRTVALSNTLVRYNHHTNTSDVYLHGNHIANVLSNDGELVVSVNKETLSYWPTPTTKSRLRALGVDVYTKNHITYLDGVAV